MSIFIYVRIVENVCKGAEETTTKDQVLNTCPWNISVYTALEMV